jgi:hypothetical protein
MGEDHKHPGFHILKCEKALGYETICSVTMFVKAELKT